MLEEIARVVEPTAAIPRPSGGVGAPLVLLWETDFLLRGDYTTRNFGECPNEENASRLSQILEAKPHPKYFLSAKACRGILERANRKEKTLPPKLEEALTKQAGLYPLSSEPGKTGEYSKRTTTNASCQMESPRLLSRGGHYRYTESETIGALTANDRQLRGDTPLVYGKSDFGTYKEDSGTLRASGGDYGGGSEMLVVEKGGNDARDLFENGSPGNTRFTAEVEARRSK